MLKFFRQIRKQLMKQNKVRSYLFYAVGEILLVVIGILIALQVNNWNEQRKQQQLSREFLNEMIKDLAADTTQFAYMIERLDDVIEAELAVLSKSEYTPDDMTAYVIPAMGASTFRRTINHRTFQKIQNSGNSNLEGYEELYDALSDYYIETNRDLTVQTEWSLDQYRTNREVFDDFVIEGGYEMPVLNVSEDEDEMKSFTRVWLFESPRESRLLTNFLSTASGRNYIAKNVSVHLPIRQKYRQYKQEAAGLIEQIKQELN